MLENLIAWYLGAMRTKVETRIITRPNKPQPVGARATELRRLVDALDPDERGLSLIREVEGE